MPAWMEAPEPIWQQPVTWWKQSVMGVLTHDEVAAIVIVLLSALSVLATILHGIFLGVLRLPCLRNYLLQLEVNAEVAMMNQSVRRAYALASQRSTRDVEAPTANGKQQQQQQQQRNGHGQGKAKKSGPIGPPRVAGLGSRGGREHPSPLPMSPGVSHSNVGRTVGGGGNVGDYAPVLILAEAKAETAKADDRSKGQRMRGPGSHLAAAAGSSGGGGKGLRGGGRAAGAKGGRAAARRSRATLVYPGDGVYEGEYIDGRKEGKGKFWYVDGTVYEGQWRNNEKHGKGKETYSDGACYEGEFEGGSRHGVGTLTYANADVYEGSWVDDIKHGYGTFRWSAGTVYEGDFADGVMHGNGTYHFHDGCTYVGEYADGKRNGRGLYRFLDGSYFEGEYKDGIVEGRGTFTFADGSAEVGRWQDGRPVGEATRFAPDHKQAWRLFDGQVTGPVSLDLADVIAQMAFRPKAARLARAVRDQLAIVHMEEERRKFANASPLANNQRGASSSPQRSRSPSPLAERPAWQGPMDVPRRQSSPLTAPTTALTPDGSPDGSRTASPAGGYTGIGGGIAAVGRAAAAAGGGGGGGGGQGRFPVVPPGSSSGTATNGGYPTFASIVSSPKVKGANAAASARQAAMSIFSPKRRSPPQNGSSCSPPTQIAYGSPPPVGGSANGYMA